METQVTERAIVTEQITMKVGDMSNRELAEATLVVLCQLRDKVEAFETMARDLGPMLEGNPVLKMLGFRKS